MFNQIRSTMKRLLLFFTVMACCNMNLSLAQGSPDYYGGFKIQFNENQPDKFLRIIGWTQFQMNYTPDVPSGTSNTDFLLRRSRLLFLGQITKKFLFVSHIGLNSLSASNMDPLGKGASAQLFLHDAWIQYNVLDELTVGGGLHYFNGISRLNNQSTLNMMTLDNNRASWATLGLTDQFARHLGVFAKGNLGNLQYQVAVNDALANSLDNNVPNQLEARYQGVDSLGAAAQYTYAGYFNYNILDKESNFLPYKVGSYLGAKDVLTVGAGFFYHPNGAVILDANNRTEGEDVSIFAGDIFFEKPVGSKNAAITAYGVYQINNYGTNYLLGPYGTGEMAYGHVGYVIPSDNQNLRLQPYASYAHNTFDVFSDDRRRIGLGLNAYLSGHHSKLTLEYSNTNFGAENQDIISLQAMIYL
jgi:hypothetical protein